MQRSGRSNHRMSSCESYEKVIHRSRARRSAAMGTGSEAEARNTHPKQLAVLLRGDLDWITMKALEKDRERRYATPSAVAADIENHLENRPVAARPASLSYRAQKYVRRHAAAVVLTGATLMLLAVFAVIQAAELRRTTRALDRADRITEFMT